MKQTLKEMKADIIKSLSLEELQLISNIKIVVYILMMLFSFLSYFSINHMYLDTYSLRPFLIGTFSFLTSNELVIKDRRKRQIETGIIEISYHYLTPYN